jgi:hypothetical protein
MFCQPKNIDLNLMYGQNLSLVTILSFSETKMSVNTSSFAQNLSHGLNFKFESRLNLRIK